MKTLASRFLTFEETLGAGLVKFAYYVLLTVLIVTTIVSMIAGIIAMFTTGFWVGLGALLIAPIQFVIGLILLRVATELVLAVLSIDDNLSGENGRGDTALAPRIQPVPPTAPAEPKPAAKKTTVKKAPTKKTTKKAVKTTPATKKTAAAAKAATRPSSATPDPARPDPTKPGPAKKG